MAFRAFLEVIVFMAWICLMFNTGQVLLTDAPDHPRQPDSNSTAAPPIQLTTQPNVSVNVSEAAISNGTSSRDQVSALAAPDQQQVHGLTTEKPVSVTTSKHSKDEPDNVTTSSTLVHADTNKPTDLPSVSTTEATTSPSHATSTALPSITSTAPPSSPSSKQSQVVVQNIAVPFLHKETGNGGVPAEGELDGSDPADTSSSSSRPRFTPVEDEEWAQISTLIAVLTGISLMFFLVLTVWVACYRRNRRQHHEGLLTDDDGTLLRQLKPRSVRLGPTATLYDRVQFQRLIDE